MDKKLAELIAGKKDPMEVAKIVSRYRGRQARQRNIEAERKKFFREIINETQKLSIKQMDSIVWEYAKSNAHLTFTEWLGSEHPELFEVTINEVPLNAHVDSPSQGNE